MVLILCLIKKHAWKNRGRVGPWEGYVLGIIVSPLRSQKFKGVVWGINSHFMAIIWFSSLYAENCTYFSLIISTNYVTHQCLP